MQQFITEADIIAATKFKLGLQNSTEWDDYFSFLTQEGVRNLNALSLFAKAQCDLDIMDGKSELPKGFYRLIGLRFNTSISTEANFFAAATNCRPMFYVDSAFLTDCGCSVNVTNIQNYLGIFQINKGFIHYNSGVGINATSANMAYLSFNIDKEGRILLYADYERALTAYNCWNFTLTNSDEYKEATIDRWERQWINQKNWIKGNDAVRDAKNTRREIASLANALLTSPTLTWTS